MLFLNEKTIVINAPPTCTTLAPKQNMQKSTEHTDTHIPFLPFHWQFLNIAALHWALKAVLQFSCCRAIFWFLNRWPGKNVMMGLNVSLLWRIVEVLCSIQVLLYELENEKHFTFHDRVEVIFSYKEKGLSWYKCCGSAWMTLCRHDFIVILIFLFITYILLTIILTEFIQIV